MQALLVGTALLVVGVVAYIGFRLPVLLLSLYLATVPFGSAVDLPLSLPPPFDTPSSLLGFAAAVAIGLDAWMGGPRKGHSSLGAPHALFAAFVGVCALTVGWSIDPQETISELVLLVSVVGLYIISATVRLSRRQLERLATAVAAGGIPVALYAIVSMLVGRIPGGRSGVPRFALTGGDPNHTAGSLLLPLMVAADRAFDGSRRPFERLGWGAAGSAIMVGITLTGSRGGLLAAAAGLLVLVRLRASLAGAATAAVIVLVVAGIVVTVSPPQLEQRLGSTGTTGRTDIWRLGLRSCEKYCISGSGWGTFPAVYRQEFRTAHDVGGFRDEGFKAHNIWLQALVETGIAGFTALVAAWVALLRRALRLDPLIRTVPLAALTAMTIVSSLVSNLTFKYLWLIPIFIGLATNLKPQVESRAPTATMLASQPPMR